MSDTPRTDARLGYENEHHGANMLCRELERELNQAIKERDENKAGWDTCRIVALRLQRERNEARGCLCRLISALETLPRNSLGIGGDGETHWYIVDELICSASKAAGLEKT